MKTILLIFAVSIVVQLHGQKEYPADDLRFENDLYYIENRQKLFTGKIVSLYPNGVIESYTYVKDGKKTGKMKLFYDSGKKQALLYEDENHINFGNIITWHETGQFSFKGYFKDGRLFRRREEIPFTGTIHGNYYCGNLYEEANFKDGYWHGRHTRYDRRGNVIFECIFDTNVIVDCPVYNKE